MKVTAGLLAVALFLASGSALAYVVKLKDGSLVFARLKYEVKGTKAIITLENGTVTQIDLSRVDVPGTEEYNRKYSGNVIALDTPDQKVLNVPSSAPPPPPRLQDMIREKRTKQPLEPGATGAAAVGPSGEAASWSAVEPLLKASFDQILQGAGIPQYRLTNFRGKVRLIATANSEEAVFNTLSAAARALADLATRGKAVPVEIILTTSSNQSGGTFEMTPDQARQIVNGGLPVAEYFVQNVIL